MTTETRTIRRTLSAVAWLAVLLVPGVASAQFDSGSDGSDGALTFSGDPGTVIDFDPVVLGIDEDRDSIYHFTTITIPAGVTVRLRADKAGGAAIHWLAMGVVNIAGSLDLDGDDGHEAERTEPRLPSIPGPGGFAGGFGARLPSLAGSDGFGPGAGCHTFDNTHPEWGGDCFRGGGGGHAFPAAGPRDCSGGESYGNPFLLPLVGGSGGGGGGDVFRDYDGPGGGAGGGAILIASNVEVVIDGAIHANGGDSPPVACAIGGGGSGGAIRIVSPLIGGTGSVAAAGGNSPRAFDGAIGRIRLESLTNSFTGTLTGDVRAMTLPPNPILLPTAAQAAIRVKSIDGIDAPGRPTGSFAMADITIDAAQTVVVVVESRNVPMDATVSYTVVNEAEGASTGTFALAPPGQTEDPLTWSADVRFPAGYSRIYTLAEWDPPAP